MSEVWLPAPKWRNHEVSSLGRVRRATPGGRFPVGHIMAAFKHANGYLSVCISQDGKAKSVYIHSLVCEAFHGSRPTPKHHAAHFDGDTENNRQENLRWATCRENAADKRRHGTMLFGERHPNAKLTEASVRNIRADAAAGMGNRPIGRKYGVDATRVRLIVRRQLWKEVI